MNLDKQCNNRVHLISILILILFCIQCTCWHKTLTFSQQSFYETNIQNSILSDMKFFMWHNSYAIYGGREKLILLKPVLNTSSIEIYSYNWSIDSLTMDECLQEWNTKDKCYNDIVHVRIFPNSTIMDVYSTYAHRPMIRSFDLEAMSFTNENILIRDPHPPMDSERSYVMLTFNTSIVTAGYQGDYIPTIRATQGKTLLYALRQNSYFIGGFKYDEKAVFGVIETSERIETNRVSRLVMTCANRAEIIRKATLNCSTDMFDQSRSFVFHILTDLIDPIYTTNGSTLLFTTFTTNNSTVTASAVCLFILHQQFYDVFTSPSIKTSRTNDNINELIVNCSQTIPSTIDRDMVETEKQFHPYLSNPLLIETMSNYIFTAINVIQYKLDVYCLIIGTSHGHLFTAFTDSTFKTTVFEELILPTNMRYEIKSVTYKQVDENTYGIIVTNHIGYLIIKLISCNTKLCFECWMKDCTIRKIMPTETTSKYHCPSQDHSGLITNNQTETNNNHSSSFIHENLDRLSKNNLLVSILIPMSFIVLVLLIILLILLKKSTQKIKKRRFYPIHSRKTRDSHTYTNNVMYRTNNSNTNKLFPENKTEQHVTSIKSDLCVRRISSNPVYSTVSSQSLPSLVVQAQPTVVSSETSQPLSVQPLYKSYV